MVHGFVFLIFRYFKGLLVDHITIHVCVPIIFFFLSLCSFTEVCFFLIRVYDFTGSQFSQCLSIVRSEVHIYFWHWIVLFFVAGFISSKNLFGLGLLKIQRENKQHWQHNSREKREKRSFSYMYTYRCAGNEWGSNQGNVTVLHYSMMAPVYSYLFIKHSRLLVIWMASKYN